VSRRLGALEEALDATLFDRGREGLTPTRSAEELLVAAEQTEAAVASFANLADGLERDVSGVVRIACPPDMADVALLPVLRALQADHPQLRFVISPGEAMVDLVRREADLAVRTVRPTRGDLLARRILTIHSVPCASPDLAARFSPMDDLTAVPWINWGPRFARMPVSQWIERYGGEPVLRTDSLTTQIAAAREGLGVALVPSPSVEHYGLVPLPFADPDGEACRKCPSSELYLVTHRTLRTVPRVKVVWEAVLTSMQSRFAGVSER
ncbi:MAG: LysR family transcriptional regulator, partial [Myxococcota bacterium]